MTSSGAWIEFKTDELTSSMVRYGSGSEAELTMIAESNQPCDTHDIYLGGLVAQECYNVVIEADDIAGNRGSYSYSFNTIERPVGLYVSDEYSTIQAAIDSSTDGDIVWIADGIYTGQGNKDIDFNGKAITVRSENGPKNCIIDLENSGRGFIFQNGEDQNSILNGLTIKSGLVGYNQYGGGIMCYYSGPRIENCIISHCQAFEGGAIGTGGNISPLIINCVIKDNKARSGGGVSGGDFILKDCSIYMNVATYSSGGGVYGGEDSHVIIRDCFIKNNVCLYYNQGGGVGFNGAYSTVQNCLFIDNFAMGNGGYLPSYYYGGGALYACDTDANIINCTFFGNTTTQRGGACHFMFNGCINIKNCIFYENYPNQIYKTATTGDISVAYSCVEEGYSGIGNINPPVNIYCIFADPYNGDFHLTSKAGRWDQNKERWIRDNSESSCIDVGDPNSDWGAELWPHGKRINMGAYGGTQQASMSLADVGNIADLNNDNIVDYSDLVLLVEEWLCQETLLREDLDRNRIVNFIDFATFADEWLW